MILTSGTEAVQFWFTPAGKVILGIVMIYGFISGYRKMKNEGKWI